MSEPSQTAWSSNPNAPQIPYSQYRWEKAKTDGAIIGIILYGVVVALFFQCMAALLDYNNRVKRGIKWGLVAHTVAMFSCISIGCIIAAARRSDAFVDNRQFPGTGEKAPPGPLGFIEVGSTTARVSYLVAPLNQWLADGLLLYRCYVLYSPNYRFIAFPCLLYLTSIATGMVFIRENIITFTSTKITLGYNAVALLLNLLLTFMIIARVVLHMRNFKSAVGISTGERVYAAIVTMLVESCALYTVSHLLYIVPLAAHSYISNVFPTVFGLAQVIGPYLIILRVTDQRALTSETMASGSIGSIHFTNQGSSASDYGTLSDGERTYQNDEAPGGDPIGTEGIIEGVPS